MVLEFVCLQLHNRIFNDYPTLKPIREPSSGDDRYGRWASVRDGDKGDIIFTRHFASRLKVHRKWFLAKDFRCLFMDYGYRDRHAVRDGIPGCL